jgi:hypothetical protein
MQGTMPAYCVVVKRDTDGYGTAGYEAELGRSCEASTGNNKNTRQKRQR